MLSNQTSVEKNSTHQPFLNPQTSLWLLVGLSIFLLLGINHFFLSFTDDEAAPMVYAEELLRHPFQARGSEILPAYFHYDFPMDLGSLVPLSMLPLISLGKQIWVVRLISAAASLLVMRWVYKIAQQHLHLQAAPLIFVLFMAVPGWLILSGTGNSAIIRTAGYTGFVYYYLQYRFQDRNAIWKSLPAALITFYCDLFGQILILISAISLVVFDFQYHWEKKKKSLAVLAISSAGCLPWLRHQLLYPGQYQSVLDAFQPQWLAAASLPGKIFAFGSTLLGGLSPLNWEYPQNFFLLRLNPFPFVVFFFSILGGILFLTSRGPKTWMWVMLFSPAVGLVFAPPSIMTMAAWIPAYILLACIMFNQMFISGQQRQNPFYTWLPSLTAAALLGFGIFSSFHILQTQREWAGKINNHILQYGSQQIFDQVHTLATIQPDAQFILNSSWSSHPDILHDFFLREQPNIQFNLLNEFIDHAKPEITNSIFLLNQEDLENIRTTEKFLEPHIISTVFYPDRSPAYYFTKLTYQENIKEQIAAERKHRSEQKQEEITWIGQNITIAYPSLSTGPINNLFDQNQDTLIRSDRLNPLVLEIKFEIPLEISTLRLLMGTQELDVFLTINPADGSPAQPHSTLSGASTVNKFIQFPLDPSIPIESIKLILQNRNGTENDSIELWEIEAQIDPPS